MRGRGINYDTGAYPMGVCTRPAFDAGTVRREMQIIADDLHCNAVRITGGDPERLSIAAEYAADVGLEVWFAPFPCELSVEQMLPLFKEYAERAERLRSRGADVVLVAGGELSIFARGFGPGEDLLARTALLTTPGPDLGELLGTVPVALNAFLVDVVATVRASFRGPITYAALPFERVDWTPFDYVAVDAYRAAHNVATYRQELRALTRYGRPVAITEFGCCTYRGAAERGARGWLILDRTRRPWQLNGDYRRDEDAQAGHLRDLLQIFEQEGVDSAFWFTFAGYNFPHRADPRHDLDLASYGVVKVTEQPGTTYPGLSWEPKASFHALATAYDSR